jgi:DNA-binding SARP family transcriptional activator
MEFRVLGPLEVWDDGRQLPITGTKQRALLAVLLLHANEIVSSDRLVDVLWAEESPESGAAAMRVRVSQLRKALPKDTLITRSPGYVLRVGREELDLHRFERLTEHGRRALKRGDTAGASAQLEEALALWRGPALADVAYESFAQAAINRLEELRLTAHELRIDADLALGRHAELIAELEGLVTAHPLREGLRAQLMLALYRAGRQAQALEVYQHGRRLLVSEIGIEPGPVLRQLERSILQHDAALALEQHSGAGVPAAEAERSILVAALRPEAIEPLLELVEPLARRPRREIILTRLLQKAADLASASSEVGLCVADLAQRGVVARAATFTTSEPGSDLVRLATEQDVDLIVVDAPEELLESGLPDRQLSALLAAAPCDVALVVSRDISLDGPVLVPFSGAVHDWAAVELAAWVAAASELPLRLLGVTGDPSENRRDASRLLSHASLAIQRALGVTAEPVLVEPGEAGILAAAAGAGLLVVGLSDRWHHEGLGQARVRLAREATPTTILVRRGLRPGGLAPRASLTRFTWSVAARA